MQTILVTEDDTDTNDLLCRLLRISGYRTASAKDGQEALEMLPAIRPDLVILDMMMPRMGGIDVLRKMRSDASAADIPVLAYSARADAAMREEARRCGATDYCVKGSVDFKQLVEMIRACIGTDHIK